MISMSLVARGRWGVEIKRISYVAYLDYVVIGQIPYVDACSMAFENYQHSRGTDKKNLKTTVRLDHRKRSHTLHIPMPRLRDLLKRH